MKISFIGDIYLTNKVEIHPDLELDNLVLPIEAPFSDQGVPRQGKINLCMNGDHVFQTFRNRRILAANLANNHVLDYGEEAFRFTTEALRAKGIPYFGAGTAAENFHNPEIVGNEVALFGYACRSTHGVFGEGSHPGAALLDPERIIHDLRGCQAGFKVVNLHWGIEHYSFPRPADVQIARSLVDNGADLVVGNHPHKMQSMEVYKGKHIYYSLGNGIFCDGSAPSYHDGNRFTRSSSWKSGKNSSVSAWVILDTETGNVSDRFLRHQDGRLFPFRGMLTDWRFRVVLSDRAFRIYHIYKFMKYYLRVCRQNPRQAVSSVKRRFSGRRARP